MSQTSTTTNEHLEQIAAHIVTIVEAAEDQLPDSSDVSLTVAVNEIEAIAEELAARIERLQRLWDTWARSRGYAADSKPYGAFLDALKACEDHGDLLPLDGSN